MARKSTSRRKPLAGQVALVAGATRGAGRGIARALGEAGAVVYCTGRSVRGKPSPYKRPETITETAALINKAGGTAIAARVDHSVEREVAALFRKILRAHGRIDIVVNSIAGEAPLMRQYGFMWEADLTHADAIFNQALTSHIITAKHAALAMMDQKRGLIVEVTESDVLGGGGNPMSQVVKSGLKLLPLAWAAELEPHGIATVAITPGFLRSEAMLEYFGVTEGNWRDGGQKDSNFLVSESPLYVGRAVAALAADSEVMTRTGMLWSSWELARDYGFTDYDGQRPDWGRHPMDLSMFPESFNDAFRMSTDQQIDWLERVLARTKHLRTRIPGPQPALRPSAVRRKKR